MKMILCVSLILLFLVGGCILQKDVISKYPTGKSIKIIGVDYVGYLFDAEMTTPWMSVQKEIRFSRYWWIDRCNISSIEYCLKDYVKQYMSQEVNDKLDIYIRQYFPFISQDGRQMVNVTLTEVKEDDPYKEEIIEEIAKRYYAVFDGKPNAHLSIIIDYSSCREAKNDVYQE